jgi:hypothetical protein
MRPSSGTSVIAVRRKRDGTTGVVAVLARQIAAVMVTRTPIL